MKVTGKGDGEDGWEWCNNVFTTTCVHCKSVNTLHGYGAWKWDHEGIVHKKISARRMIISMSILNWLPELSSASLFLIDLSAAQNSCRQLTASPSL